MGGQKSENGDDKVPGSLDALLAKASPAIRSLYEAFRERVIAIDEKIIEKPTAYYVGYRLSCARRIPH